MIGGTSIASILGALPDGEPLTNPDAAKAFVRALCDAGVAVMLIQPGTKEPADMRTPQKKAADDRGARELARMAGRPDADRVRAPSGLYLATTDKTTACRYVDRYFTVHGEGPDKTVAINLAIEVGRSNLVVVDCDTADQVAEFLAMCGAPPDLPPTVATPGKLVDGQWVHKDGGHFYFTVDPEKPLPAEVGSTTIGETGIAVLWYNRYVLIPPSVRAEGSYQLLGRDYPVPAQLRELIEKRSSLRRDHAAAARARVDDEADEMGLRIDSWARQVSWSELLAPHGWVPVARPDVCGCPVLTAPGNHANPKSATAHEAGCAGLSGGSWTNDTNAPLHIWTDHPGEPFETWIAKHSGLSTITKFQAAALLLFDGDQARAMDVLGIAPGQVSFPDIDVRGIAAEEASIANMADLDADLPLPDPAALGSSTVVTDADISTDNPFVIPQPAQPVGPLNGDVTDKSLHELIGAPDPNKVNGDDSDFPIVGAIDETSGLYMPVWSGVPQMAPFKYWRDLPPPEYVVDGLLEHGGLTCIIGPSGVGKSSVALDIAAHVCSGRNWQGRQVLKTKVLYLPGEGLSGAVQRLLAWEEARGVTVGDDLILGNSILQLGATTEAWAELCEYIAARDIGLIIFDTYARMSVNLDENSATDAGRAIKRFDNVRKATHAGVLVIHHTGKANPDVGRGSSALMGALDSEILVYADPDKISYQNQQTGAEEYARPIHLRVTKQKNAEKPDEELDMLMVNWNNQAPLITGPNGRIDPMQGEVLIARPVPEPLIETAARIRVFVDRFPEQGLSRTDIAAGVTPDPYTQGLAGTEKRWRLKVTEAVDRSLGWRLLATPEGSSAKYVPGPVPIATARQLAAAEVMTNDAL